MYARAALACSLVLFAAGCSSSPSVRECSVDSDCGPDNACQQRSCAGNEPPTSAFSAPVAATTHRLVSLAPASTDPEGRPMEHRWSIRAVVAGCDPDPEPGDGPVLDVVFWCPGTYEATLVSIDDFGAEGAPKILTFAVSQATGAPSVTAGPAIGSRHSCDRDLPACAVKGPDGSTSLNLSAVGTDPADSPLTWEWTAYPPPGAAADPALEVSFASGRFVATPTVSIGNGGGPIAGLYRFRARVRNTTGLLAQAFQEVVVANGAPTASPGPLIVGHRYADGIYLAEGEIDTGASDPDDDLLVAEGALAPAPPAGCTEEVTPAPNGRVHVRIACSVATALIGASPRNLTVAVVDANGAGVAFAAPLAIANQPPSLILNPAYVGGLLAVDHRVEPCVLAADAACFVADGADPFVAFDPDGDPLSVLQVAASVAATKSASRGTASVDGATSRFRFETPTGLPGQFRTTSGGSGFSIIGSVSDSFGATASLSLPLFIRNRAPVVKEPLARLSVPHHYDAAERRYRASATGALFEDPDGDPLVPTVSGSSFCSSVALSGGRAAIGCERSWDYTLGGVPPLASLLVPAALLVVASDGWESASSPTTLTVLDRPATLSSPVTSVENCVCTGFYGSWMYAASTEGIQVPVRLDDPDGDPSLVALRPTANPGAQPLPTVCVPGWCYPRVNGTGSAVSGSVSATAGTGITAAAPFTVMPTCSFAQPCLPPATP